VPTPTGPETEPRSTLLTSAARSLARAADLDITIDEILAAAAETLVAAEAVVLLQDPDRTELQLTAAVGMTEAALGELGRSLGDPDHPIAVTAREGRPPHLRSGPAGDARTFIDGALIVSRGGIDAGLGALSLAWSEGIQPPADALLVVEAVADLLAVAIDRVRLASMVAERAEWFERLAHTDPLTGLANLRTFNRVLELELARAARQGSQVSVAVFDVDDFAATNDRAGRDAGDDVLRGVASVVAESVRLVDTVARAGADEFVVVAPGPAGSTVAGRVIAGVGALPAVDGRGISVSAGVATFPVDATSADELLALARTALERARADGPGRTGDATGAAPTA
jgi:diguanylate cyclase (GGDEF)-like protein